LSEAEGPSVNFSPVPGVADCYFPDLVRISEWHGLWHDRLHVFQPSGQQSDTFKIFFPELVSGHFLGRVSRFPNYRKKGIYVDYHFEAYAGHLAVAQYRMAEPTSTAGYFSAAKYNRIQPDLDQYQVRALEDSYEMMCTHFMLNMGTKVLTWQEAFEQVDLQKSPGFPWSKVSTSNRLFFSKHPELHGAIEDLWALLLCPEYPPVLWQSVCKEELRSVEKLEAPIPKLRTFTSSSLPFTLCAMRLCVDFNKRFYLSSANTWSFVGRSMYGGEWNRLYHYLNEFPHCFALDESSYDCSLFRVLMWGMFKMRWDFMSTEYQTVDTYDRLFRIYDCLVNSVVVLEHGDVFWKHTGNPSGSVNTIVDNTCCLYRLLAYAWLRLAPPEFQGLMHTHVRAILNGDDNTFSVSNDAVSFFNGESVSKEWTLLGITTKSSSGVWQPRPASAVDFLSHTFIKEKGWWLPCPEFNRVYSSLLHGTAIHNPLWSLLRAYALRLSSWANPQCRTLIWDYIKWLLSTYKQDMLGEVNGYTFDKIQTMYMSDAQIWRLYTGLESWTTVSTRISAGLISLVEDELLIVPGLSDIKRLKFDKNNFPITMPKDAGIGKVLAPISSLVKNAAKRARLDLGPVQTTGLGDIGTPFLEDFRTSVADSFLVPQVSRKDKKQMRGSLRAQRAERSGTRSLPLKREGNVYESLPRQLRDAVDADVQEVFRDADSVFEEPLRRESPKASVLPPKPERLLKKQVPAPPLVGVEPNPGPKSRKAKATRPAKKKGKKKKSLKQKPMRIVAQPSVPFAMTYKYQRELDNGIVIPFDEYLFDLNNAVSYTVQRQYSLNPGVPSSFPKFCRQATGWEAYSFEELWYEFIPFTSELTSGSVMFACDYDATDTSTVVFDTQQKLLDYSGAKMDSAHKRLVHHMDCRYASHIASNRRTVRTDAAPANADLRLFDIGQLYIATAGGADTSVIGKIFVHGKVRFWKQRLNPITAMIGVDPLTTSSTTPFGPNTVYDPSQVHALAASNMRVQVADSATGETLLTFRRPGLYCVEYVWEGAGAITANATPFTAVSDPNTQVIDQGNCMVYQPISNYIGYLIFNILKVNVIGGQIKCKPFASGMGVGQTHWRFIELTTGWTGALPILVSLDEKVKRLEALLKANTSSVQEEEKESPNTMVFEYDVGSLEQTQADSQIKSLFMEYGDDFQIVSEWITPRRKRVQCTVPPDKVIKQKVPALDLSSLEQRDYKSSSSATKDVRIEPRK
jgi:hypothetical protein